MTDEQTIVYEILKDNCGGKCLTDPENGEWFDLNNAQIVEAREIIKQQYQ